MTTSATATAAARAAFTQLVDYAGLFPPAKLEMAPSLAEYVWAREGPFAWMLGRFIVPASRISELLAALQPGAPVPLSVIVDAGADPRAWLARAQQTLAVLAALRESEPRVRVEALEVALPPLSARRETYDASIGQFAAARKQAGLDALSSYVEIPHDDRWKGELEGALFALSRHGLRAKLRCGGVVAEAFPSASDVAVFICAAIQQHRLPFKATAGLHHPIRHLDHESGATMHGFLNLLAAAAFALKGMPPHDVLGVVSCEDPHHFRITENGMEWEREQVSVDELRAARENGFISYGSCSFAEPTSDLQTLGIL
ncbi:MAG TPA: hypothetical protein VKT72_18355 [Candidatus Baltobacteraceae bacterium]|nr:hypothetical protein [Candidatus Baltobacteraceae bacterium]